MPKSLVDIILSDLEEAQHSLQLAYIPFKEEDFTIQPVQCRGAINSLEKIHTNVGKISDFLNEVLRLPFIALRYRLLFILHVVEEQVCRLVDLIDGYRVICTVPSQHEQQVRREISISFERLLGYVTDIPKQAQLLDDHTLPYECRPITYMAGHLTIGLANATISSTHATRLYIVKEHDDSIEVPWEVIAFYCYLPKG
jgi:hypothetical protein